MVWENPPGRRQPPERGGPPQGIEEFLNWLKGQYKFAGSPNRRGLLGIVLIALIVLIGLNSFYTVNPQETAVVQRFGRFTRTADSGLHFKIPFGIDKVTKVVTGKVEQREYGYRTVSPDVRSKFVEKGFEEESLMLSGDLNVVNLTWTVQYKISDPVQYLFRVSGVEGTLDDISESVVRRIVGNRYADEVLTTGRASIAGQAKTEIQEIMDQYKTGLHVVTVNFQNVNPPKQVEAAFNEVSEAGQEKERMINEAQQAYNQKIPKAVGEARQAITQAEGYALEKVNRAEGEIKRFNDILAEYLKAPEVSRRRMYLDSFESLMGRIDHVFVIDDSQKNLLPLFDINKVMQSGSKAQASGQQK